MRPGGSGLAWGRRRGLASQRVGVSEGAPRAAAASLLSRTAVWTLRKKLWKSLSRVTTSSCTQPAVNHHSSPSALCHVLLLCNDLFWMIFGKCTGAGKDLQSRRQDKKPSVGVGGGGRGHTPGTAGCR